MESDSLEIETAVKVDRCDDVSSQAMPLSLVKIRRGRLGNTHCKVGTIPLTPVVAPGVAAGVVGVTPLP